MKRISFITIVLMAGALAPASFGMAQTTPAVRLPVPYVSEVPDGRWIGSWKNACEESSITQLQAYYSGQKTISIANTKAFMQGLFNIEHKLWNSDANTDTARTLKLITDDSDFNGRIVEAPTVDAIKAELDAGRPVIVPLNGFTLGNKNIPFLASGSGYHMFVIIGYDAATGEFITNDTGDTVNGPGHRYKYARLMNAIHDYDSADKKTDGLSRVIFTYPKLAKTADSHRIYFLSGNVKQYVSHPAVFAEKGWSWSWVNVVLSSWLVGFKDGASIKP
jgi:Peptidase_C39 like family